MAIRLGKSATVGLGMLALASTAFTGCTDIGPGINIPASLRTPTIAGVVDAATQLPDGRWRYQLGNGQVVDIDYDQTTKPDYGGPDVGRLLLWGVDPDGRAWVLGVSLEPTWAPGCFRMYPPGRGNRDWIETNSGYRLRKSPNFRDTRSPPPRPTDMYGFGLGA